MSCTLNRVMIAAATVALVAAGISALSAGALRDYELAVTMQNAGAIAEDTPVQINGFPAGSVSSLETRDGKAIVHVSLNDESAPLHSGTQARVRWKAVLGERVIELLPGPDSGPEMPSGSMISATAEQVELDQVLSALDSPTRKHLTKAVKQLDGTLKGRSKDLKSVLETAGPTVGALGDILRAVGQDGHAIRNLVLDLRRMTKPLAHRQQQLGTTVNDLTETAHAVAPRNSDLHKGLGQLPGTLREAKATLDEVPGTVDKTVPLLRDLRPAADRLTSVAKNLSPVLTDLRPAMAELRPTLASASNLLNRTPGLLDTSHQVLPAANNVAHRVNPAVSFLRPYTPDVVGWLGNWGSAFANYDARGHVAGAFVPLGLGSVDENPGVKGTLKVHPAPPPGMASRWTDANGSGIR